MFRYYVSFTYQANNGVHFSAVDLNMASPVRNKDDVETIRKHLADAGYSGTLVLGFSLYETAAPAPHPTTPATRPSPRPHGRGSSRHGGRQ